VKLMLGLGSIRETGEWLQAAQGETRHGKEDRQNIKECPSTAARTNLERGGELFIRKKEREWMASKSGKKCQ